MVKQHKKTIIITTHYIEEANRADRVSTTYICNKMITLTLYYVNKKIFYTSTPPKTNHHTISILFFSSKF